MERESTTFRRAHRRGHRCSIQKNRNGNTALHIASSCGLTDYVHALIAADSSVEHLRMQNSRDDSWQNDSDCWDEFEQDKAKFKERMRDANYRCGAGSTALHIASCNGHADVVRALIAADPSVEHVRMQNRLGNTALITACLRLTSDVSVSARHTNVVRALIAADGSVEHLRLQNKPRGGAPSMKVGKGVTKHGKAALDVAVEKGSKECAALLRAAGGAGAEGKKKCVVQ